MACCGGQRQRQRAIGRAPAADGSRQARRHAASFFRYRGRTSLGVQGPATGRYYRFGSPGAVVGVDPRDAASLARVPQLLRVMGP